MSTEYTPALKKAPNNRISFSGLRKDAGRRKHGLSICEDSDGDGDSFCLTDGEDCLWATRVGRGAMDFTRYGGNDPSNVLAILERAYGVRMVSEHDDEYFEMFK